MTQYNVNELKRRQDNIHERRSSLREAMQPFREALIQEIDHFAREAEEAGLEGVRRCKKITDTPRMLEVSFMLNEIDFTMISTNTVEYPGTNSASLAAKMFFYLDPDKESTPDLVITFQESQTNYVYAIQRLLSERSYFLRGITPASAEAGVDGARVLINYVYDIKTLLTERPTLGKIRAKKDEAHPIGFPLPGKVDQPAPVEDTPHTQVEPRGNQPGSDSG